MSFGPEPQSPPGATYSTGGTAERIVSEVVGEDVDWVSLVRRYPFASLAVAAGAGYLLAVKHGPAIVDALSDLASRRVSESVERLTQALS